MQPPKPIAVQGHIFVDNSNIIGGAQIYFRNHGVPWPAVRIYWKHLFRIAERDILPATRVLAGSLPPDNDALWDYARQNGYDTALLRRVERDDGRLGEQGVDETLHARISAALLDYEPPQSLILLTGDGRKSDFKTSFLDNAKRAAKRGWAVSIYSWKDQMSNSFKLLKAQHPTKINLFHLDDWANSITFIKGGTFNVEGAEVNVKERVVSLLQFERDRP